MSSMGCKDVFFVEWDKEFITFIKGITFSPSLRGSIVVHIFYPQNLQEKFLPNYQPWLFKHPTVSDTKRNHLEDYIMMFKFNEQTSATLMNTSNEHKAERHWSYYLITKSEEKSQRLAKAVHDNTGTVITIINGVESTILDFLEFKCTTCKVAFKDRKELMQHDKDFHSLLCLNKQCKHYLKQNSFGNENDYKRHVLNQRRCKFCPGRVFCSTENLELHMQNTHKKCSCPCGEYFGNRQTYLDHFFSYYPSPKRVIVPKIENHKSKQKRGSRNSDQSRVKMDVGVITSEEKDFPREIENDNESLVSSIADGDDSASEKTSL